MSVATETPVRVAPPLQWWKKHRTRTYLLSFLFVLPALINFTLFRYYPIFWAGRASLWEYSLLQGFTEFVGLENYIRAFTQDPSFWDSLRVTLTFAVFYVPSLLILALALALFANQPKPGMGVIRAIIFVPVVTSFIVVSIVWGMILNKDVGLLNSIIATLGFPRLSFLNNPDLALPTLVLISLWKDVGYSVIILVAGLRGIPSEFYDAALVEGANAWQRLRYVTLPALRRQLMFVSVISTLFAFQVLVPVFQLTQGGPNRATNVIAYYIYRKAFIFGEMGYASALSIILLGILLLVSVAQIRILRAED